MIHRSLKIRRAYIPSPTSTNNEKTKSMITRKSVPLLLLALGCSLAVASVAIGVADSEETAAGAE